MNEIKIIENFLDKKNFNNLKEIILNDYFPWYFNDGVVNSYDNGFQFTHNFYSNNKICSDYFNFLNLIFEKIKIFSLLRVKANLLTKTNTIQQNKLHVDFNDLHTTTMIYYLNTNNGYTYFEDNQKIYSKENRAVFFKATTLHSGTNCTDENRRVLLNINYIESEYENNRKI